MKTVDEIRAAVEAFKNDTVYKANKVRWEADFDMVTMETQEAKKGFIAHTSNTPSIFVEKLISMICKAKLNIRIPLETLKEDERVTAGNTERFLYGCLNINDERLLRIPRTPPLRRQRAFLALVRGGFARCAYVYKDKWGRTIPLLYTWDLYSTAYGTGANGTAWACNWRPASKMEIKGTWDVDITSDESVIYNFWDEEKNGAFLEDGRWLKNLAPHRVKGGCPVTIHLAGSQPKITESTDTLVNQYQGESGLKNIRKLMPLYNAVVSDFATMVHRGVKAPVGVFSKNKEENIEVDIWDTKQAVSVPFDLDTKVVPLFPPGMPADTLPLLQILDGEKQRGTFPNTAYGELGFRLSGFAINQLQGSMETTAEPFVDCIEQSYKMDCMQLIDQYAEEDWTPLKIRGRTSYNTPFGLPSGEEMSPKALKKGWYPEITLIPVLPKDDAQRHQLAQLARQPNAYGDPLLSDRTILDIILGIEDPDLENEKKDQEWADKRPVNRLYQAFVAELANNPDIRTNERARNILVELRLLLAQTGQAGRPTAAKPAGSPSPTETASAENAGTGLPPTETGMPASTMPPEMMGGMPGGAMGAGGGI